VFDVTSKKSFKALDLWLRELKKFGGKKALIVLVGNKVCMCVYVCVYVCVFCQLGNVYICVRTCI